MTLSAEIRYKTKLKYEGHDLIRRIARLGTHKRVTYSYLSKELEYHKPQLHFADVHDIPTLLKMVDALQKFHDKLQARRVRKPLRPIIIDRTVKVKLPEPIKVRNVSLKKSKRVFPPFPRPPGKRMFKDEALTPDQIKAALNELRQSKQPEALLVPPAPITEQFSLFSRIVQWFRMLQSRH